MADTENQQHVEQVPTKAIAEKNYAFRFLSVAGIGGLVGAATGGTVLIPAAIGLVLGYLWRK